MFWEKAPLSFLDQKVFSFFSIDILIQCQQNFVPSHFRQLAYHQSYEGMLTLRITFSLPLAIMIKFGYSALHYIIQKKNFFALCWATAEASFSSVWRNDTLTERPSAKFKTAKIFFKTGIWWQIWLRRFWRRFRRWERRKDPRDEPRFRGSRTPTCGSACLRRGTNTRP